MIHGAAPVASLVKNLHAKQEMQVMQVWSLGQEYSMEEGMATHSSILAWRIPWTEEPGGLQSMGSQRVGHNWRGWAPTHRHSDTYTPTCRHLFWGEAVTDNGQVANDHCSRTGWMGHDPPLVGRGPPKCLTARCLLWGGARELAGSVESQAPKDGNLVEAQNSRP